MYVNLELCYLFGKIISNLGKEKKAWFGFDKREVIVKSSFSGILSIEYR